MKTESQQSSQGVVTWRDLVITPLVEVCIFGLAIAFVWVLSQYLALGALDSVLLVYLGSVVFAIIAYQLVQKLYFVGEGVYSYEHDMVPCYVFNLGEILLLMNLGLFYSTAIIPPLIRKQFYQLLGTRIGSGMVIIGGRIEGPQYVTLGENVVIGDDAVLYPHIFSNADTQGWRFLTIARIEIGRNAIVGSRSTIMPGVKIGDNAMIGAMSFVPMNTVIPAGEIWSGVPARKVGEVPVR